MVNYSFKQWEACIELLEEIEQIEREMGETKHLQYRTRFNKYTPLMRLGRLDEAQRVVQECLSVFREADDLTHQSKALSALANIWDERGDIKQAIALQRQALSICNRLPDPFDRAPFHNNLANYFTEAGKPEDEARHLLAGIIYSVISTPYHLSDFVKNLRIRIHRAAQSGRRYELPRISDLLTRPEFEALGGFLEKSGVDLQELQAQIDQMVEQARQEAAEP
jgi:tetratricopeptide (TPR) repeat protein